MRTVPTPLQQFQLLAPGAHGAAATWQRTLTLCARGAGLRFTNLTDWLLCFGPGLGPVCFTLPVDLTPQEYCRLRGTARKPQNEAPPLK